VQAALAGSCLRRGLQACADKGAHVAHHAAHVCRELLLPLLLRRTGRDARCLQLPAAPVAAAAVITPAAELVCEAEALRPAGHLLLEAGARGAKGLRQDVEPVCVCVWWWVGEGVVRGCGDVVCKGERSLCHTKLNGAAPVPAAMHALQVCMLPTTGRPGT
jgi:hypothetical protein